MNNIYLVRHGETLWNATMRFQGTSDISLSEKGIMQAKKLAKKMKSIEISAIYASDLKRASETARYVAEEKGLNVNIVPDLREMCFGKWEGHTKVEIDEISPNQIDLFFSSPDKVEPPDGETFLQVQKRVCSAFYKIAKKHTDENILIVSHGGSIRTVIADILDMHLASVWRIRQDNTAFNIITLYKDYLVLSLLNDTSHLK